MSVETPPSFIAGTFGAEQLRRTISSLLQRGSTIGSVVGGLKAPTDMAVTAGSGMQVLVAAGEAWVPGTTSATQGGYYCRVASSTALSVAAASLTNPRVDLVVAQVQDAAYSGATNSFGVAILTGTPTSGATLSNLSGAPSITASSLALAYVLVPANASSISNGNILPKAVPAIGAGGVTMTQPTRAFTTVYQPNTTRPTFVCIVITGTSTSSVGQGVASIGVTNTPGTQVAQCIVLESSSSSTQTLSFSVPAGWYYEITGGNASIVVSTEFTL